MVIGRPVLLGFIILFGFCARASTYKSPLFEHHGWRQSDTASISRNFYRERFNPLYPQVDQRGSGAHGYVETGFELAAWVVAASAFVIGFHSESGRILNSVVFVGSCLLVWAFVKRRYGEHHALVAAFLYAFGFPLLLFIDRAFMNEPLLIFLSLLCLTATQRYLERHAYGDLALLVGASSLIGAVKAPYLIIWAPIAGLFAERYGLRAARRGELLLMGAANLAVVLAWYSHAHGIGEVTGLSFGMSDKLFDTATVFSTEFPVRMLDRMARDVLEPVGLIGLAVGLWVALRRRLWCEALGVAGFVAYLVIVARGNFIHDYYQLAIMPVAPVLAALGLVRLSEVAARGSTGRRDLVLAVTLALALLSTFIRSVSAHSWYEYGSSEVEACQSIQMLSDADERVMFVGDNNPQMLFCIDRKGWLLADYESDLQHVTEAWRSGAKLAVVPRTLDRPEVRRFVSDTGQLLFASRTIEVYRLP